MRCEAPTWQIWSPFPCPGPQRTLRAPTFFPWVAPMARSGHQAWVGLGGQPGGPPAGAELRSWGPRGSLGQGPPASRGSCSWGTKAPPGCSRACSDADGLRATGLDRGPGVLRCPHTLLGVLWLLTTRPPPLSGRKPRPLGLGRSKQSSRTAAGSSGQRVASGRLAGRTWPSCRLGTAHPDGGGCVGRRGTGRAACVGMLGSG